MRNQLVSALRKETWKVGSVGRRYGRRYEGGWGKTRTLMYKLSGGDP